MGLFYEGHASIVTAERAGPSSHTSADSTAAMADACAEERPLRVTSWNVGLHGLQALCSKSGVGATDTHGIRRVQGFGSLLSLLEALDADIICLQEVKLSQLGGPERSLALAEGWESYFSLCRKQTPSTSFGRYAGVAIGR